MKRELIKAGLWKNSDPGDPEKDILAAWIVLSRLKCTSRSLGLNPRGLHEYAIVSPTSGNIIYSCIEESLPLAICKAALKASKNINLPLSPES